MAKPTARACATLAHTLAAGGRVIPYVYGGTALAGLDCRGYVLYVVRALGGTARFAGATDLWQNHLTYSDTTAKAKAAGKLVPGALLFHIENGTAEHVGWYTGIRGQEVAHASQGNGRVVLSPLSSYYGHVGWAAAVDYAGEAAGMSVPESGEGQPPSRMAPAPGEAVVAPGESGGVRLRKQPRIASGNVICEVPRGAALPVLERRDGWTRVAYTRSGTPHAGWMRDDMLTFGEEEKDDAQ